MRYQGLCHTLGESPIDVRVWGQGAERKPGVGPGSHPSSPLPAWFEYHLQAFKEDTFHLSVADSFVFPTPIPLAVFYFLVVPWT